MINFEHGDELVGLNIVAESKGNPKPRKIGLIILRNNGRVEVTDPVGTNMNSY